MAKIPPICDFGEPAKDFRLPGVDGKVHSLSDIRDKNGFLVMFICNHCPYVLAILDRIIRDAQDLKKYGVGVVAICSNDAEAYPDDSFKNMKEISIKNSFPFPYLVDESQTVASSFGAVCTPDFFGYNSKGELQYRGRLDASRKQAGAQDLPRDLFEAMVMIAKTGAGPRDQIASMGCSIKWKN